MSSKDKVLCFGVELELYLEPRKGSQIWDLLEKVSKDGSKWVELGRFLLQKYADKAIRDAVKNRLGRRGFLADWQWPLLTSDIQDLKASHPPQPEEGDRISGPKLNLTSWVITRDGSLEEKEGWYPYEFVSPVFRYGPGELLGLRSIHALFLFFDQIQLDVRVNQNCSTHIHLSPELELVEKIETSKGPGFTFRSALTQERLNRLACSAFYFELVIRSLLPDERLNPMNVYAREYHSVEWMTKTVYNSFWQSAENAELVESQFLAKFMSLDSKENFVKVLQPDDDRCWAWNYQNLLSAKSYELPSQSIEFRWPGGSLDAGTACRWVKFMARFTASAYELGEPDELRKYSRTFNGLESFMSLENLPDQPSVLRQLIPGGLGKQKLKLFERIEHRASTNSRTSDQIEADHQIGVMDDFKDLTPDNVPSDSPTLVTQKNQASHQARETLPVDDDDDFWT